MRASLSLIVILVSTYCGAAQLVDPYEIMAESPKMLDPDEIFISCTDKAFDIALEKPIGNQIANNESFKLASNGGNKVVKCSLKGHLIESEFSYSGSSGSGYCGGVKFIQASISIDSKRILYSPFANYCTMWGMSSIRIKSHSEKSLDSIIACGYWPITETTENGVVESRTYSCTNYNAEDVIQKNHRIGSGPNYITPEH